MNKINIRITKEIMITAIFLIVILVTSVSVFMKLFKIEDGARFEISKKKIEIASSDSIFFRMQYVNLWGMFNNITNTYYIKGKTPIVNLNNGYLSYVNTIKDTPKFAKQILDLNEYVSSIDIPMLYVLAPFKISKYDDKLPIGIEDYTNYNADNLINSMNDYGVDTLDLRKEIKKDDLDHYSLFFKTDHHWKPEAGLWATEKIASVLNENYDFDIDLGLYNIKNYDVKTYEKWFLGSQGRRVSIGYASPEDINMITPKFETNFRFTYLKNNDVMEGDFKDTILDYEHINIKDYYNEDPYSTYLRHTDYASIKNLSVNNRKKILFIKDSFGKVVIPYLALDIEQIDIMSFSTYESSIKEYINDTKPDIVIILYNAGQIEDANFDIN